MDLQFECDNSLSNRLHTVQEALDASVYETVDLKVKIMMKSENKQPIVHGGKTTFKTDSIVADETTLTKAKVWERYGKVWAIYDPYVGMIWDS